MPLKPIQVADENQSDVAEPIAYAQLSAEPPEHEEYDLATPPPELTPGPLELGTFDCIVPQPFCHALDQYDFDLYEQNFYPTLVDTVGLCEISTMATSRASPVGKPPALKQPKSGLPDPLVGTVDKHQ